MIITPSTHNHLNICLSRAMRTRFLLSSVLVFLHIMTWVSATSRPLPPDSAPNHAHLPETESVPKEVAYQEMKKIGSTPPNCWSKCHGCSPCVAIQVPTINVHFSLQYANYLPEGWKCKCGPSFYSP